MDQRYIDYLTSPQAKKDRILGEYTRTAVEAGDLSSIPNVMELIDKTVDDALRENTR